MPKSDYGAADGTDCADLASIPLIHLLNVVRKMWQGQIDYVSGEVELLE